MSGFSMVKLHAQFANNAYKYQHGKWEEISGHKGRPTPRVVAVTGGAVRVLSGRGARIEHDSFGFFAESRNSGTLNGVRNDGQRGGGNINRSFLNGFIL